MKKIDEMEWIPYTHPTPPTIRPIEDDEPVKNSFKGCEDPLCKDPSHD